MSSGDAHRSLNWTAWGADAVIVSTEGPIDEQVRGIVGPRGVKYAIDPVVGETGTQMR
jgi:NADPH:quinone reductase-like Zn-dependent oxidoreductase